MLTIIGTLLSGVFSGGATGIIGILIQKFFEGRAKAQDLELVRLNHQNALELRRLELEAQAKMADRSAQAQEHVAELDAQAREAEADARNFDSSMAADRATYLAPEAQKAWYVALIMALVDLIRGLIRPGATIYGLVLLTLLLLWVQDLYKRAGVAISPAEVKEIALQVISTITYLAVTCTVWWFGVRPSQPKK